MITGDYPFERKTNKRLVASLMAAVALASAQAGFAADTARVTAVRFWSLGDITRVAIEVSSEFTYKSDRLPNPDRLFYDIHGATPAMVRKGMESIPVGDGLITQIRVAEVTAGVTRVVIDLAQPAAAAASQLSNPDRLVVEVRTKDKSGPPQAPSVTGSSKRSNPATAVSDDLTAALKIAAPASKPVAKTDAHEIISGAKTPTVGTALATPPVIAATIPPARETKNERTVTPESNSRNGKRSASLKISEATQRESAPGEPPARTEAGAPIVRAVVADVVPARLAVPPASPASAPVSTPATSTLFSTETHAGKDQDVSLPLKGSEAASPGRENAGRDVVAKLTPRVLPKDAQTKDTQTRDAQTRDTQTRETPPKEAQGKEIGPAREPLPAKRGDRDLTRALGLKLGRVVLDAGHGGHDVGTHGPSGYLEKDLALDVTQRLGALIEERLGSEVIYTRPADAYVGLEERTRIANDRMADLFLSIHANSSPYRSAAGVETYVLNFTTSKNALELASRENASAQSSIFDLQELVGKIALKEKIDESREFATRLQAALSVLSTNSNDVAKNRGVKRAPFIVLIGANMPSVLAEIGFLTNATDEALLRKPEHRQKIAEALYKGIASYASTLSHFQIAQN